MHRHDRIERLYREHIARAAQFAYLLTGSTENAEDIAHEAFLRCASRADRLRSPERFGAYLAKAVARMAVDNFRSSSRRAARELASLSPVTGEPRRDPDELSAARMDIMTALDLLPPQQRAVVVLRYWLDYSELEIAATAGCAVGTVKSRLSRAHTTLKEALDV